MPICIGPDMAFTLRTRDAIDPLDTLLDKGSSEELTKDTLPLKRQLAQLRATLEELVGSADGYGVWYTRYTSLLRCPLNPPVACLKCCPTRCRNRSWSWRPRIRSNRKGPMHCRN
jgi:hypothetical protein